MTAILKAIVVLAAVIIVVRSEPVLNRMSPRTPFMIRMAFHLLALGGAAEIVCITVGETPSWPAAIVTVGIAALLFCERRLRLLCPCEKRSSP